MPFARLSLVAAVVLFASKASLFARAVEFCPAGSNPSYIHAVTTAGADDQALSCTVGQVAAPAVLTINLRDVPASPGAASSVRFQGTVNPLSAILVRFPSFALAASRIPLSVTISNNQFEEGSGLQITGSLPPSSTLTISGNTFAVSAGQQPSWFINTFTAIALYPESDDTLQFLNDGAQVAIADNTITGTGDLGTFNAAVGISWRGGVSYGSSAGVQIVRNSITLACQSSLSPNTDVQACVVGVHMLANQFFTGFASSLLVDANAFAITGGLVAAMPPVSSQGGVIGTLVSFSDNTCQATTTGAVGPDALTFGFVTIASDAQYAIKNNTITLTGTTACGVGFSPKIPVDQMWDGGQDPPSGLTDTAVLAFSSNTVETTGCDAQIHFGRDHQLASSSRFLINSNSFTRQDQLGTAAAIQVLNSVTLQDSAAVSISGNTWSAPATPPADSPAQLIAYSFSLSAGVTGPVGSVRACGNVLQGTALVTDADVRERCPDSLTLITASECFVDVTEDTLQNTFPPSTTSVVTETTVDGQTFTTASPSSQSLSTAPTVTGTGITVTDAPIESTTPDLINNTEPLPTTTSSQPSSCHTFALRIASVLWLVAAATLVA